MIIVLIFTATFFGLVATAFIVRAFLGAPAGVQRRLRRMESDERASAPEDAVGHLLPKVNPWEQAVFRFPLFTGVKKAVEQSGLQIPPALFLLSVSMVCISVLGSVQLWRHNIFVALAAAAAVGCLPFLYLGSCKKRRETKFAEQLPEALTMIARSLRAGHSMATAVELIGQEMPQPAAGLFKAAYEQQQLGMRIAESLSAMTGKINSVDLHFFVTIVKVNSESGGNLAEILEKLAETVKSRLQIRRQVQTYTAEGRISGYVLLALPVVVFFVFRMKNPKYMEVFFTVPVCQLALVAAVLAQIVGYFIMRKIVSIRI